MSRPIKISDELYDRLKGQAESDGLTLQGALVDLLVRPHDAIASFERQLEAMRATSKDHSARESKVSSAVSQLREEVSALAKRVVALEQGRTKNLKALNSWTETWRQIPGVVEDIDRILPRVDELERLTHRHTWQNVDDG